MGESKTLPPLTQTTIDRQAMRDLVEYYQMVYCGYAHTWYFKIDFATRAGWWKLGSDLCLRINAVDELVGKIEKLKKELEREGMTEKELNKYEKQSSEMFTTMTKGIMKYWKEDDKREQAIDRAIEEAGDADFVERQQELRKSIQDEMVKDMGTKYMHATDEEKSEWKQEQVDLRQKHAETKLNPALNNFMKAQEVAQSVTDGLGKIQISEDHPVDD